MVRKHKKYYSAHGGKLDYVEVDKESKEIKIKFEHLYGSMEEKYETIEKTYEAIKQEFLDEDSVYQDYSISMTFTSGGGGQYFSIQGIDGTLDDLRVKGNFFESKIEFYIETFPEVDYLYLSFIEYDNIEQLNSFEDLKYLYFGCGITEAEKEYILSVFPECYLNDNTIVN